MTTKAICYCGAEIVKIGPEWKHTDTHSMWCYEEEADLDPASRCNADPDPGAALDGEEA